jgi:hypothetical protein
LVPFSGARRLKRIALPSTCWLFSGLGEKQPAKKTTNLNPPRAIPGAIFFFEIAAGEKTDQGKKSRMPPKENKE